ncbi:hypothetical protein [Helicobacter rodentium]|uniref:hypothetical protein n=1 Tax=Helicobacter rodentium TaxID=59617 RepID=UPI002357E435|nr:hypothetical protein [Helicobacter rodentium]
MLHFLHASLSLRDSALAESWQSIISNKLKLTMESLKQFVIMDCFTSFAMTRR